MPSKSDDGETFEFVDFDSDDDNEETSKKKPDSLAAAFLGTFSMMNIKLIFFLFLIFMFVNSDVFITKILSRVDNTTIGKEVTTKGVFIQGLTLVLFYIVSDTIISAGYI